MTSSSADFSDQYGRRGTISQIALTVFVGIPSTIALAAGLAVYCTFQCAMFAIFPGPKRINLKLEPQAAKGEKHFTASLAKLADVHGPTTQVSTDLEGRTFIEK